MPENLLCAWIGLAALLVATPSSATTIRLGPVTGQYSGGFLIPDVSAICLLTPTPYAPALPKCGLLEYPLDGIPDEASILAASIDISVTAVEQWNRIRFSVYPADGRIDLSDFRVTPTPYDLGFGPAMDVPRSYSKSIDPEWVQSFLATSTHIGFVLASSRSASPIWLDSPQGVSPVLTVTYVPEPAGLLLLLGGVILATSRRLPRAS